LGLGQQVLALGIEVEPLDCQPNQDGGQSHAEQERDQGRHRQARANGGRHNLQNQAIPHPAHSFDGIALRVGNAQFGTQTFDGAVHGTRITGEVVAPSLL
jgi:hypothetical protein